MSIDEQGTSSNPSTFLNWWTSTRRMPAFWIILIAVLAVGFLLRGGSEPPQGDTAADIDAETSSVATTWTCSMHPQVKLPEPGQCPICFMDLIPLANSGDEDEGPRVLSMSETAKKIGRIVSAPVERRDAEASIQMVGKIDYDETRIAHIASWVGGRLDRLYVDYTGIEVRRGDHLVLIYSPELLAAQEELLQALEAHRDTKESGLTAFREAANATVQSARDKLRLWGLTDGQVKDIEDRGSAEDHVTIYAPIGGVVIEKSAFEGKYVSTGTHIYTIADLSQLWLRLEAFESDLKWLRYGQQVTFTAEALPGEEFTGTIAFIDPILDPTTRTVRIRVNVPNSERKLKPSMFVRATVKADIAASGLVTDISLAGKWMCPMHSEIVEDRAGDCPICEMPLVPSQSLGYTDVSKENIPPPLVIPASAPLITGKRAVVYVEIPDRDRPTYEGREVVLGPRAGDYYLVESGLAEGELVVVNGAFKIDSELQIRAKPSMMSPEGGGATAGHDHGGGMSGMAEAKPEKVAAPVKYSRVTAPPEFAGLLAPVYDAYFDLQRALADDDQKAAASALDQFYLRIHATDATALTDSARHHWDALRETVHATGEAGKQFSDDEDGWDMLRSQFEELSGVMIDIDYLFGHAESAEHYVTFCPMAFNNRGAYWLSDKEAIANPYFGHAMQKCGKVTDRIQTGVGRDDD